MIYIALVVGIILLVVAGVLARKNSQIIADKDVDDGPSVSSFQYTVHMMDEWEDQDSLSLIPLFHTTYVIEDRESQAYLCRVTGRRGELKLHEAENVMLHNIQHAKLKGSLLSGVAKFDVVMNEDEKLVLQRLELKLAE